MGTSSRHVVYFLGPRDVEVRRETLAEPGPNEVRVRTTVSGISPGTERLIYRGKAPNALAADPTFSSLEGESLDFPLRYGYACVGVVEATGADVDADWQGARVFGFHPHASAFVASPSELVVLPDSVSNTAAALLPSAETAVNLLMDGRPTIGEDVLVFGQGVVGLLTTALLSEYPLGSLRTIDPASPRRQWSMRVGAEETFPPSDLASVQDRLGISRADPVEADQELEGADLIYETSGNPEALNDAVACAGFSARVLVGSWYGTDPSSLSLGGRYHRSRVSIKSSQVSTIAPELRGRWTKARRMQVVRSLLERLPVDSLITHTYALEDASQAYEDLDSGDPAVLQPILRYD